MFDWLRKATGAVGNAVNQGASFVARPYQQTFNQVSRGADDARRRLLEQQRAAAQAAQQARQQAQQQAQVNAQRLQQAVPKLNMGAAMSALGKVGMAANPANQFKMQAKTFSTGLQKANQFGLNQAGKSFGFNPQQVQDLQRLNPNDRAKTILNQQISSVRKNPMMGIINSPLNPMTGLNQTYRNAPVNIPKPDLTNMVDRASKSVARSRVGKNPVVGFIGDAIVRPLVNSPARWIDASTGQEQYAEGTKGLAQGGTDAFNMASLLYTPAKAGATALAIKQGGLRAGAKFIPSAVARGFGSGVGVNALNQASEKGFGNIDTREALTAGAITGVANAALPFAPGVLKAALGRGNHVAPKIDFNAPQVAKNLADKGRLRAEGFTNIRVGKIAGAPSTPSPTTAQNFVHNVDGRFGNKNKAAQTEIDLLKQHQREQLIISQRSPNPIEKQGALQNYKVAQDRIDVLENPKVPRFNQDAPKAEDPLLAEARKYKSAEEFVKSQGTPVYHGTVGKFDTFDPNKLGSNTGANSAKEGFFFTPQKEVARTYVATGAVKTNTSLNSQKAINEEIKKVTGGDIQSRAAFKMLQEDMFSRPSGYTPEQKIQVNKLLEKYNKAASTVEKYSDENFLPTDSLRKAKGANIVEAYVKMDNPLVVDAKGAKRTPKDYVDLSRKAKEAGNDGVIIKNTFDRTHEFGKDTPHEVRIAFNSDQIKTKSQLTDLYNQANSGRAIAETAPQPTNPEALLKKAGYKLNKDGDWIDPKGKEADFGEMQQVIQNKTLTQDENLIAQGKMKYAQAEADTTKIANGAPIYETAPKPTVKELNRGTIETVKGSPNTKAGLRKALENQPYEQLPNEASMTQAVKVINKNPQAALNEVLSNKPRTTQLNAQGLILAEKAQQRGDFETAQQIFKAMSPGNTQQGQAIQILSVWSKTKPEGVVKYAQKLTDDANNVLITEGKNPSITLSAEQASKFRKMATDIAKMPEGKDKLIATQKMLNEIHQTIPATIGEKLSTAMYYAQLLNPKTAIRNIVGNLGFAGQETLKDAVGAPIDATLTGLRRLAGQDAKRSVYLPNPIKQLKWGYQGAKEAMKEAKAGVNLSGLEGQLQIGNKQPAFRGKAGGLLSKAMQTELSVPDRAFYTARYQQTLHNLMKAEKVTKPTRDMLERADYAGKYATFQDDSRAAQAFVAFKKGLNKVAGTKDETFGLGNFVINYPKTPGNIISRGLDYSPVGFVKSTMEMAKPLFRKGPFDQQKFVESFSRATVGTGGLLGTGALLNQVGIITGKPSKDKDVNAQDKATGLGAYRINVSALKRFVTSGFNPESGKLQDNDTLVSYDWFQPAAIGLSMGANINETRASDKGAVGKLVGILGSGGASVAGGIETITNQPLVQGLTKFTGNGGGLTQGMLATAMGIPASFIPTILNQVNQLVDNTARNTYDPNVAQQGLNMVKAKIPGLASTLPAQIGPDGTANERYQDGGNNVFNVMFNPAFTGKYQANDVQKEITRLENSTGQTSQYPNIIKNTQTVNGKDVQLSAQQVTDMQRLQGSLTQDAYSRIMGDPNYAKLSDTDKVKKLQNIITQANQIARIKVLGDPVDDKTTELVKQGANQGKVIYGDLIDQPKVPKAKKPKKIAVKKGRKASRGRVASIAKSKQPKFKSVRIARGTAPKISKTPRLKLRSYT